MLDLQFVCDNPDVIRENCAARGVTENVSAILELRDQRGDLIRETDDLRHQQKEASALIPKEKDAEKKQALIAQGKQLREAIATKDEQLRAVQNELNDHLGALPNLTHPEVPAGGEDDAKELRKVGTVPKFDFEPQDHVALCEQHDLLDLEMGSRVAGHGFYFLKNELVVLEQALVNYALDVVRKHGFTLFTTPDLARDEVLQGIGFAPRGPETQIYSIQDSDLSLVATAEITLGGGMKDQTIDLKSLPVRWAGLSHCFRTEAGAHGRAARGIYRVHQFTKVEIFGFTAPDLAVSGAFHEEILAIEEEIFSGLEIPFRVIDTAAGDLGGQAYRKFDLEAWMPGRGEGGTYGEVTSTSNCTDYQARRLNIRCKEEGKKGTRFVHTLNGTAIATTRALIALLENNQNAAGQIAIPQALHPWTGFERIG